MKKIPTIFVRGADGRITDEPNPAAAWVFAGEGVPTRKWDGTCVLIRDGKMFARREVKPGKQTPPDFELVEHDEATGKRFGWVPVVRGAKEWDRHWEAFDAFGNVFLEGTYELCGPRVNGNPENLDYHILIRHGLHPIQVVLSSSALGSSAPADLNQIHHSPRSFAGMEALFKRAAFEGIVWHHADGRMAKIKRRDFGLPWPPRKD